VRHLCCAVPWPRSRGLHSSSCHLATCIYASASTQIFEKVHMWWGFSRIHASRKRFKLDAITNLDGSVFDTLRLRKPRHWGKHWHEKHGEPDGSIHVRAGGLYCEHK
jgi:hypothetical protein